MNLRIYNIWHNKLFPELYAGVSNDDMANVVMFGVNERYKKEVPPEGMHWNIQYEYDLAEYNPKLQQHGYCQSTAMYHIYKNGLHKGLDYIGFVQYDMKIAPTALDCIKNAVSHAECKGLTCIFHELTIPIINEMCNEQNGLQSALEHYNAHFGTSYTAKDIALSGINMPVVHTFIIPVAMFEKMMGWICSYIEWLESIFPKNVSNASQAEFLERCHGLFLVIEYMQDATNVMVDLRPEIEHIWPLYHDKTEYDNYKTLIRSDS
jgi:hypothetical protein